MQAKQVKRLADIADVAKMDLTPNPVTLAPSTKGILAWYAGVYVAGGIDVELGPTQIHSLTRPVSIAAAEFHDLVALYDDGMDVDLRPGDAALEISAGKRRATLQYLGTPDTTGYEALLLVEPFGHIAIADFQREMTLASNVTADQLTQPILQGIRVILASNKFGVQAANGSSLVFQSMQSAKGITPMEIVSPATDLAKVLGLLRGDEMAISLVGNTIILRTDDMVIKLPKMMGKWPKMSGLSELEIVDRVELPVAALRALAAASRAYKASTDVIMRPGEDGILLETRESELGQFRDVIPGTLSHVYAVDAASLDVAVKVAAEATILIQFSKTMAVVEAGGRKLYVGLRVER